MFVNFSLIETNSRLHSKLFQSSLPDISLNDRPPNGNFVSPASPARTRGQQQQQQFSPESSDLASGEFGKKNRNSNDFKSADYFNSQEQAFNANNRGRNKPQQRPNLQQQQSPTAEEEDEINNTRFSQFGSRENGFR